MGLCERATIEKLAVVMDVREGSFLDHYATALQKVRDAGYRVETLFLTAADDELIARYKATRRKHPLQGEGSVVQALTAERAVLDTIRASATHLIDTTGYNVHALRKRVLETFAGDLPTGLNLTLMSFGFKHGIPREADYVFNVRFLPNPFFVPDLKEKSGLDKKVSDFVLRQEDTQTLLDKIEALLLFTLPKAIGHRTQMVVAIGCTGGQHRSVALAEELARRLGAHSWDISTLHRDVVP